MRSAALRDGSCATMCAMLTPADIVPIRRESATPGVRLPVRASRRMTLVSAVVCAAAAHCLAVIVAGSSGSIALASLPFAIFMAYTLMAGSVWFVHQVIRSADATSAIVFSATVAASGLLALLAAVFDTMWLTVAGFAATATALVICRHNHQRRYAGMPEEVDARGDLGRVWLVQAAYHALLALFIDVSLLAVVVGSMVGICVELRMWHLRVTDAPAFPYFCSP